MQNLSEHDLAGAAVLITGAGQRLADTVARRFATAGARLALAYMEEDATAAAETARATAAELSIQCDPADPEAVRRCVRQTAATLDGLDVLVNTAMLRRNAPSHRMTDADWLRVVGVELSGTLFFCREAIRPMMRRRRGRIINLTDVSGMRGEAAAANHSSARGGVAALTRALASELAPHGIFVNAVAVSYLEDELGQLEPAGQARLLRNTPMHRAGRGEEVADAALFLASAAASFTTGHLLQVNGGLYL